ncbi:hypothetical protein [Falsiporphyromonas endometrii]|uniref:Uncharacterized protein n=1 Tax=Falsiporphyromonas endometrii TaxID=1387297 RepID=A0ABV9K842_9PORP
MKFEKEKELLKGMFLSIADDENEKFVSSIHDLFIQVDQATGDVQVYDDNDKLLASKVIYKWIVEEDAKNEEVSQDIIATLKDLMRELQEEEYFDSLLFETPLSVQLVRSDFSVIEELLFVDDDIMLVSDPLLKGVDEDLDKFISKLLAD